MQIICYVVAVFTYSTCCPRKFVPGTNTYLPNKALSLSVLNRSTAAAAVPGASTSLTKYKQRTQDISCHSRPA